MTNLIFPNASYESLMRQLEPTGGEVKKIAYKTHAAIDLQDNVVIWHHENPIALIGRDSVRLSNAGWTSKTTADRLHRIARDNGVGRVFIKNYTMWCQPTEGLEFMVGNDSGVADGSAITMDRPVLIFK